MSITTRGGARSGTVEFIGWAAPQESSEIVPAQGPIFDADTLARTAQVHEAAGFDRVLIGYFTNAPDGFLVGAHVAHSTERLGLLLAHRPGFVAPTLAARKLATLDQLTRGRTAVHIISGGSDEDQARDGDFTDHAGRYRRSAEYVRVLRRTWAERRPFDHHGEFYRVEGQLADITPWNGESIPVYGGGGSDAAIEALAPEIDTFMLWGEPIADTIEFSDRVRKVAADAGNDIRFSVSTRPILGRTEGEAWDRAHRYLETIVARTGRNVLPGGTNVGSQRLLDVAARSEVFDRCLYTPLAAATGQLDGPGRHARDGGRGARRLRRRRRRRPADPRLRAAARRRRVRRGADPPDPGARRRAGEGHRSRRPVTRVHS
jgi:alkanesulfonate monooxygenase